MLISRIYSSEYLLTPVNGDASEVTKKGFVYEPEYVVVGPEWDDRPRIVKYHGVGDRDLTGNIFGRLTVLGKLGAKDRSDKLPTMWVCRCACGRYVGRRRGAVTNARNSEDRCNECRHFQRIKNYNAAARARLGVEDEDRSLLEFFPASGHVPTKVEKTKFYNSWEWQTLRMEVLKEFGPKCMCCGATPETGAVICIDHILPLHTHWDCRLDRPNMQVLCHECNKGKGAWDITDWRRHARRSA